MNILFIITGLKIGGAEKQVCDLSDHFISLGHNVQILSLTGMSELVPRSEALVHCLFMKKEPFTFISAYFKARRIIKNFKPDVVHSHMFHANIFSRLLRLTIKMKNLINTAHSSNEGDQIRMSIYRLTDRLSNLNTGVSKSAVRSLIKKGAVKSNRIIHVYNGIDTKKFAFNSSKRKSKRREIGIAQENILLLSVGRLTLAKDYPTLVKSFLTVSKKFPESYLYIIGDGEKLIELEKLSYNLNLESKIKFMNQQTDIENWMSACDLFVSSSQWEGFSLVAAEAMACERPIVATRSGGIEEVISSFGTLVNPENPNELAKGIEINLTNNHGGRFQNRLSSRNHIISNFSLPSVANTWLKIYQGKALF